MKIFITGANGFIGSHVVKRALEQGHEVVGLRRTDRPMKIDLSSEPKWIEGTLEDNLHKYLKDCEAVIHLAAYGVNPEFNSRKEAYRWNVSASLGFLEQAKKANIRRFVIAGSCSEYGKSAERYDYVPCDAPLEPVDIYGLSKAEASIRAMKFAKENKLELAILRPFHIFGEGESEYRFWPSLKNAALSGNDFPMTLGEQIRDFTPVEFAADAFIDYAANSKIIKGEPVINNLGTGKPQSLKSFAKTQWKKFNAKGKLKFGEITYRKNEVMRYVPHINNCL